MKANDQERLDIIVESIEKGNGIRVTCKAAQISVTTYYDWIDPDSDRFNSELSERIKKARSLGDLAVKETCEAVIMKAAVDKEKPVWQAAAWMLERKFREEYGQRQTLEHNFKEEKRAYIDDLFPPDDELKEAEKAIENKHNEEV